MNTNAKSVKYTNLYSCQGSRDLDKIVIENYNLSSKILMQRAGESAFSVLKEEFPDIKSICVIKGAGNNAGDGEIVANCARAENIKVSYDIEPDTEVIVDALLGTGLAREVSGDYLDKIKKINSSKIPVLSLDIPSGLNADTGMPQNEAIIADVTVTFISYKQGMFTASAKDYTGKIILKDLGVPIEAYLKVNSTAEIITKNIKTKLPKRKENSYKNTYGHVVIIGGNYGMAGAVRIAAESAMRSGAGKVSVITKIEHVNFVNINYPEIMCHGINDITNFTKVEKLINSATSILIGPGLGQDLWAKDLLLKSLKYIQNTKPLILDADALNILSKNNIINKKMNNVIVTPHIGEAAKLLGIDSMKILNNRYKYSEELSKKYEVCVLKGSGTIVSKENNKNLVCINGNSAMATAGMGDLLSGLISGLSAQGLNLKDAAALGVYTHAKAGDNIAEKKVISILATDLLSEIGRLLV